MRKAFCLISGGIDSTTCLHKAIMDYRPKNISEEKCLDILDGSDQQEVTWVEAFSVDYGQRHKKEGDYAKKTCDSFGIKHGWLKASFAGETMLTDPSIEIPSISYADIKGVSPTYVPFRNGTMLSLITAKAQQYVNDQIETFCQERDAPDTRTATEMMKDSCGIYFGAHAEDAANWAYPDCTPEFIGAMANAIYIGSYMCIRLHTPLQWLNKVEIIELGEKLAVNWDVTWSCYAGNELHCGTCPTCRARKAGFVGAGVPDPTRYAA